MSASPGSCLSLQTHHPLPGAIWGEAEDLFPFLLPSPVPPSHRSLVVSDTPAYLSTSSRDCGQAPLQTATAKFAVASFLKLTYVSQSTWISAFERDEQAEGLEGHLGKHSHGQLSLKEICPSPSAFWIFSPALNSEVGRNFLFLLRNSEAMEV